ncbi:alpha/beta hydrolase [Siculibacillus lacustris]|uniref:Alpha/beta hydrolase n=1 Tax=Siculibacillus lacustris TaxID=1549641 RepID=A0A4Q9VFL5_9HYPH|nr:alpha/beta hydrolase [Siculibacillus lacustris]TBW33716.1 alpha/beta hydrolase [Siculibacillus lacustris]
MTPSPDDRRRRGATILATYRVETSADGLEYATRGDGPAVLALHGGLGGWDQSALLDHLLAGEVPHTALAVSRPGHLGSPAGLGRDADAQADAYARLLDRQGFADAVVMAISGGGPCALAFAHRHPERCRGLVLVSAATDRLIPKMPLAFRILMLAARIKPLVNFLAARAARDPERADRRAIPDPDLRARVLADPDTAGALSALRASLFARLPERLGGLALDLDQCRDQRTPEPGAIACPTLIVHAVDDVVVPHAMSARLAERIAGAELMTLEGGGHMALFTDRRRIADAVARFLAALPPPKA